MILDEPVLHEATVTCRTEACKNADIPLTIWCTETVICGMCGQVITDITLTETETEARI